jgi:DNA repair ATPase RecN
MLVLGHRSAAAQQPPNGASTAIHSRAEMTQALGQMQSALSELDKSHAAYQDAVTKVDSLYSELSRKAQALGKAAGPVSHGRVDPTSLQHLASAAQDLQKTERNLSEQYVALQQSMQQESQQYATLSTAMRIQAEAAKDANAKLK